MAKKKSKSRSSEGAADNKAKTKAIDLFGEERLSEGTKFGLALAVLWLCVMIIFSQFTAAYVTGHWNHFNLSNDNISAAAIAKMGEDFDQQGDVPNWCPYIFCGMPMVGSLMYINHYYWAFNPILKGLFSFLFLGSHFGWLFIHYIIAGLGIYWLLRYWRVNWIIALLFGILFAFNHTMVAYADVGHGSKVLTTAYLPWLLYFTIRMFERPRILWMALIALFFGYQLRAHHIQIAYYGVMMMGLYMLFCFTTGGKADLKKNFKATGLLTLGGIVGLAFAAPVYLQILEYAPYIQRETGAIGSAAWDYATAWSFHPLESLSFILPSFYGFGRETYWGFMPFTDMPLYWGGLILLFAPWAVVLKRDKTTWFFIIMAVASWIISFGDFLPVLYGPLYKLLPYFDKFRVPSLIQILLLLSTVLLAARGLNAIFQSIKSGGDDAEKLGKKILKVWLFIAGGCVLLLIFQAAGKTSFLGWMSSMQPRFQGGGAVAALGMIASDALKLLVFSGVTYVSLYLILAKKQSYWLICIPIAIFLIFETGSFSRKLIRLPTPLAKVESYLAADDVVKFIQQDKDPNRFLPLSNVHHPDWYMPHHLESVEGYAATKMRLYQNAKDSLTLNNPNLLQMMNVRYIITDQPVNHPDLEEVFAGRQETVYRYKREMPRAFLVHDAVQVATTSEIFDLYRTNFDFRTTAVLEEPLPGELDGEAEGSVVWLEHNPDYQSLDVTSSGRQLLVVSEMYYPSGWRALVDGVETPIYKCNFMFRAIEIPAGDHQVVFTYRPLTAGKGIMLRWIALIVIIAGIASSYFISRRKSGPSQEAAHAL